MRVTPGDSPPVVAAGALTWRMTGDRAEVLLIHRPRYDDWSLPKGKLDPGETFPEAAVREVTEETGYRVRLHRPLPASVYLLPDGRTKIVQYWTATVRAKVAPGPQNPREVDEVRWVGVDEAEQLITRQTDQVPVIALRRFLEADELVTAPIIVQRHAAAVSRSKWRKGEESRPLRSKGKKQAKALLPLLDAFDPTSIVSSPWQRCRTTVEPLAKSTGLTIGTKNSLSEAGNAANPSRTAAVFDRVLEQARATVVCTHRPVLPTLLASVKAAAAPGVGLELPKQDPYLAAGEALLLHTTPRGTVVAVERHLPHTK